MIWFFLFDFYLELREPSTDDSLLSYLHIWVMHKEYLYGQILRILFFSVSVIFGRGFSIHAAPVGTNTFGKAKLQLFFLRTATYSRNTCVILCCILILGPFFVPYFESFYVFRMCEITSVCDVGHFSSCDLWLLFWGLGIRTAPSMDSSCNHLFPPLD